MREIKFRGKNYENIWIYGDLLQPTEICYIYEISDCNSIDGTRYEVNENTIGQYTGLKDKNGKEIYEGDILEHFFCGCRETDRYIVEWDTENLQYAFRNIKNENEYIALEDLYNDDIGDYAINIIGNIYDNLELLKEDK